MNSGLQFGVSTVKSEWLSYFQAIQRGLFIFAPLHLFVGLLLDK